MGLIKNSRFSKSGLKKALAVGVSLGVMGSVAFGQVMQPDAPLKMHTEYLGYAAGVSARLGFSDNINLQRSGLADDEYFVSTLFTGGAIVSKQRVTAVVLGDLDFSYLLDGGDFRINQNIGATSTFTLEDNLLYFDLSGSTTRQLVGDNARFSGNLNAARGQRANVHSYSASPYIFHEFPDQGTAELRYRFTQVYIDKGGNFSSFGGISLNNSTSHEGVASYETGTQLGKAHLKLTAYGNETKENTRDFIVDTGAGLEMFSDYEYRQGSVMAEGQFALSPRFSLSGAVGYDEVEPKDAAAIFFTKDELSGGFWRAGFTARSGDRSHIRLEYGQRYDDEFIDADMFYALSKHFTFTASAGRSFRTRAQSISAQTRTTQRMTLDFVDRLREGQELSPRNLISAANFTTRGLSGGVAQTTGVAVSDSAHAALNGTFVRTDVSLSGFYSDDDFGFRQTKTYGAGFDLRRRISRRLNAYGGVTYRHADTTVDTASCEASPGIFGFDITDPLFDAVESCATLAVNNGVSDTVLGRIGASYRLYENIYAYGEYSRAERFSDNQRLEYTENAALFGVTLEY